MRRLQDDLVINQGQGRLLGTRNTADELLKIIAAVSRRGAPCTIGVRWVSLALMQLAYIVRRDFD
jgi:hypothetical protein